MRSPESEPPKKLRTLLEQGKPETFVLYEGEKISVTINHWAFIFVKKLSEWKFICGEMQEEDVLGQTKWGKRKMMFQQRIEDVTFPERVAINVGSAYKPLSIISGSELAPLLFRITLGKNQFTIIALTNQKTTVQIRR